MQSLRNWMTRYLAQCRAGVCVLMACLMLSQAQAVDTPTPNPTPNINPGPGETLKVGSKRFTESYILAHVIAQQAQGVGAPAHVLQGLGNTAIVYNALRSGNIDVYPEYLGTISLEILKLDHAASLEEVNQHLAPLGLGIAVPLGFNDGYALAMRAERADQLHIKFLSDLAKQPQLKFGLSHEFIGRSDGWPGLAARYALTHTPTGLDHGLAYEALAKGQVDVMDIYTTDAKINHLGLTVLTDDAGYFPRYDAVLLYRLEVPQRFPAAWQALLQLKNRITETDMINMNARAELNGAPFNLIAHDFLAARLPTQSATPTQTPQQQASPAQISETAGRGFWAKLWGADLWRLTCEHIGLVALSVGLAVLIGIPLSIIIQPHARLRALVLGLTGLLQTVPSLALLAMLISWLGVIGALPALIALTLYSLLPIMRNTCAGLSEVPRGIKDAGLSLGLHKRQVMREIELPMAKSTIIVGIRVATTIGIGTATIAAFIGAGGYGERIVTGLALNDNQLLLAGALPATVLALLSEGLFELLERKLLVRPQR